MKRKLVIANETFFDKPYLACVSDQCRNNNNGSGFMSFCCWKEEVIYSARKDSMFLVLSAVEVCYEDHPRRLYRALRVIDPEGKIRILDRYTVELQEFLVPVKFDPET